MDAQQHLTAPGIITDETKTPPVHYIPTSENHDTEYLTIEELVHRAVHRSDSGRAPAVVPGQTLIILFLLVMFATIAGQLILFGLHRLGLL